MKRSLCCLVAAVAVFVPLTASGEDGEDKVETIRLLLHPAPEPCPALKYQLLPNVLDRKPGNAAVMYNKLGMQFAEVGEGRLPEEIVDWLEMSLADLPRQKIRETLDKYRHVLDGLELAARRERCDWELPIREQNFISLLLPELQKARGFARLLAVKARLEIAEGKIDEALDTLKNGYALGRHVAEGPTLINAMVGMAICRMMSEQVQELIQQPESPNLYWALTSLPRPLIDTRKAMETEMYMLYLSFPVLGEVDDTRRSPEHWQHVIDRVSDEVMQLWGGSKPDLGWRPLLTAMALKGYPQAKRYLIQEGRSAAEVEAMPVPQVVILSTVRTYDDLRDQTFKWFSLPYWEAHEGMREAAQYLATEGRKREIVPVASLLMPALGAARLAVARNDRTIAVLRTIEALRLYGAAHEGRLPKKLADVTEVPVPIDPVTGKAFAYSLDGDTAVLEAPAPPNRPQRGFALRYEIKFAP